MGFSEDVLEIVSNCSSKRQTLLLSATLRHDKLKHLIDKVLKEPQVITVSTVREPKENITQQIILADENDHKEKLLKHLLLNLE